MVDSNRAELSEHERLLRLAYDEIYEINVTNGTFKAVYVNDFKYVSFPLSGNLDYEAIKNFKSLIYDKDWNSFLNSLNFNNLKRIISNGKDRHTIEYRRLQTDGKYYWTSQTISQANKNSNEIYFCVIKDIHEIKKSTEEYVKRNLTLLQEQLKYHEDYDVLTGIYNKKKFYEETSKLLLIHNEDRFVMLRFDIGKFKIINEFYGKAEGDELLKYIAKKIKQVFCSSGKCTFARLDADIFYICFLYSEENLNKIVDYIEKILKQYDLDFEIIPSFGAYIIENNKIPIDLICDRANLALKTVKGNYIKRLALYDEVLRMDLIKEQEIVNNMNIALIQNQFKVYLQPKCDIQTGKIVGAEALVRWIHPEKGMIPPCDFIPIFERNGFIMKLDAYIWEKTCKLIRSWNDSGKNPIPISVNISRINLYNPKLCDILINLVEKYNIPVELFQLEITESAYTENQQVLINVMKRLQNYGFVIMMDDFGSGYSSLNMLKDIPVDVLKIDMRFLVGVNKGGRGGSILSSVVRMAKWLNISVVAEGIETKEQASFLLSIGCSIGQGFYFHKPMPISEFEEYLNSHVPSKSLEEKLRISNSFNIDDFWDPKSNTSLFFNNMVSAVGIYEYNKGSLEAIRLNDQYFQMIGITREDFFYETTHIIDWVYEDDRNKLHNMILNAINTRNISEGMYRRLLKNGKTMWLHAKITYLTGTGDRHLIYVVMNDITIEIEATEMLQSLFKFVPGGIFRVRNEAGYPLEYANDLYYKIHGYSPEQLRDELGNMTEKLIHTEDVEHVKKTLNKAINNGEMAVFYETRVVCRGGDVKHLLCGNGFMYTSEGVFINIIIFDIDYMSNARNLDKKELLN